MANPIEQFKVLPITEKFEVLGYDLSFTNSSLWMAITVIVSTGLMLFAVRKAENVPNKGQYIACKSLILLAF